MKVENKDGIDAIMHLSKIAKIRIDTDSAKFLYKALGDVLDYANRLSAYKNFSSVDGYNDSMAVREDFFLFSSDLSLIISNAPVEESGYFVIPAAIVRENK